MLVGDVLLPPEFADRALARAVLSDDVTLDPVTLTGFAPRAIGPFAVAVPGEGTARALIWRAPAAASRARLDWFLGIFGLTAAIMATPAGRLVGFRPGAQPAAPAPVAPAILAEALAELDAAHDRDAPAQLRARLQQILVRAASRHRAGREAGDPPPLQAAPQVVSTRYPYGNYFALAEQEIAFPLYRGGHSQVVNRAAFLCGDAVTVLPYDPPRDRVLLVEQFRFGPWMRGAPNAWSIEPIAGRIDPGETPEATARREAVEEAGLTLGRMHHIGDYYPSPGAVSEYLYSYVAEADLPDDCTGIGGLDGEDEDIRALLWSYDELAEAVRKGRITNGPLLLSALWLQLHRDRLQAGA